MLITRSDAGLPAYRSYIERLWGWHCAFERQLWEAPWPAPLEPAQRVQKLDWLAADLDALGLRVAARAALPQSDFRPKLDSTGARFGLAYVVEGAQLGVRVLRKRLAPQLHPWQPRWLQGYGAEAPSRWKIFLGALEQEVASVPARAEAAAAAQAAFASLVNWFDLSADRSPTGGACATPVHTDNDRT